LQVFQHLGLVHRTVTRPQTSKLQTENRQCQLSG
jgi:hypothetical protein